MIDPRKILVAGDAGDRVNAIVAELRALGAAVTDEQPDVVVNITSDAAERTLDTLSLAEFRAYLDATLDRPWTALKAALAILEGRTGSAIVHVVMEGERTPGVPRLVDALEIMVRSAIFECRDVPRINIVRCHKDASPRRVADIIAFFGAKDTRFVTGTTVMIGAGA